MHHAARRLGCADTRPAAIVRAEARVEYILPCPVDTRNALADNGMMPATVGQWIKPSMVEQDGSRMRYLNYALVL
jgi:hypothetical protein